MAQLDGDSPEGTQTEIRLVLEGGHAALGEVPAADVARLIDGAIRAIARSAEVIAGREPGQVGRSGTATENATRFVLRAIEPGSVAIVLGNPLPAADETGGLDLDDPRLTDMALGSTLDSLSGIDLDAYVARGLADLADELAIGSRYTSLRFEITGPNATRRSAVLNRQARTRLRQIVEQSRHEVPTALVGTLVEADFERHTARLRTSNNTVVRVNFTEDHADEIQRALRQSAEFEGIVTFNPDTSQAIAVEMRAIRRTQQLGLDLDDSDYWRVATVADLAAEQGVEPVTDLSPLHDTEATDQEIDDLFEALHL
jgi:hypothetical protein